MGIRERRDREHEATRQAILDAARDLFVAEGYENVSIRKIAERVEYSPAAIYGYFTGKEEIFFALAESGFRLFARSVKRIKPTPDPLEMLRRRFWQYYQFSKAQPEYFASMFVDRAVPRISREWEQFEFTRRGRDETAEVFGRCIESGVFPPATDPGAAFHILAAAIHGAAGIRLSDRLVPRARRRAGPRRSRLPSQAFATARQRPRRTDRFHATRSGQPDADETRSASRAGVPAAARKAGPRRGGDRGRTARAAQVAGATKRTEPTV
jgi:AcrR family transcriptional regulator